MTAIRVVLPQHLRTLADVGPEVTIQVDQTTIGGVLDALEGAYPVLRGTIRGHSQGKRRPFMRYFMCEEDVSHDPLDTDLQGAVVAGDEVFRVLGAIAGG